MPWFDDAAPSATDSDAIHDNVAGEIAAVTEKAAPVSADLLLIEDSAASNAKKKVQVGNLPSGGGAVGGAITTPPASGWSWVNQGSATETSQSDGSLVLATPPAGSNNLIIRRRSHSSGDIVTARLDGYVHASHGGPGMALLSASDQITFVYLKPNGSLTIENWSTATSFSSGVTFVGVATQSRLWLQVEDDGTDTIWRYSTTGYPESFVQVTSVGRTSFLTGGPTTVGYGLRDNNANGAVALQSWAIT